MSDALELDKLEDEDQLQQFLAERINQAGWDAIREVSPDRSDYSVDLLLLHPEYGRIGVETKYIRPGDGGRVFAKACQQIVGQYWNQKYLGEKVTLWAIAPYFEVSHQSNELDQFTRGHVNGRQKFVREFFCRLGIGFINLSGSYVIVDFAYSVPEYKIPGFELDRPIPERHYENVDPDAIRESVQVKRDEFV